MSAWDFIRESYEGATSMLAQYWPVVAILVAILIAFGLILTDWRDEPLDDEPALKPLSQSEIGKIEAFINRGTRALPSMSLAERQAEELIELCFAAHASEERGEM